MTRRMIMLGNPVSFGLKLSQMIHEASAGKLSCGRFQDVHFSFHALMPVDESRLHLETKGQHCHGNPDTNTISNNRTESESSSSL